MQLPFARLFTASFVGALNYTPSFQQVMKALSQDIVSAHALASCPGEQPGYEAIHALPLFMLVSCRYNWFPSDNRAAGFGVPPSTRRDGGGGGGGRNWGQGQRLGN